MRISVCSVDKVSCIWFMKPRAWTPAVTSRLDGSDNSYNQTLIISSIISQAILNSSWLLVNVILSIGLVKNSIPPGNPTLFPLPNVYTSQFGLAQNSDHNRTLHAKLIL